MNSEHLYWLVPVISGVLSALVTLVFVRLKVVADKNAELARLKQSLERSEKQCWGLQASEKELRDQLLRFKEAGIHLDPEGNPMDFDSAPAASKPTVLRLTIGSKAAEESDSISESTQEADQAHADSAGGSLKQASKPKPASKAKKPKAPSGFDSKAARAVVGKPVRYNDLKLIEGVGPKIAELLEASGIQSWEQLALQTPADLEQLLESGGGRFHVHNPQSWPEQAKLAAGFEWQRLKDYQDQLKAG